MESSFEGKDYVCGRLLQYLLDCSWTSGFSERLSFQLLESLLYRVQLSVFTGRLQNALAILQVSNCKEINRERQQSNCTPQFPGQFLVIWHLFFPTVRTN